MAWLKYVTPILVLLLAAVVVVTVTRDWNAWEGGRILTRKSGASGAKSYIVNGKMTEGFAFVVYPAEYRSSGVMTFVVGADGVVYEKDLGRKTEVLAKSMKEYNPASGWRKAEEQPEESAGGGEKKPD